MSYSANNFSRSIQPGDSVYIDHQEYTIREVYADAIYFSKYASGPFHALVPRNNTWQVYNDPQVHTIRFEAAEPISALPSEMLYEILAHMSVEDALNLCQTRLEYQPLCQDWKVILRKKYPAGNWSQLTNAEALKIDLKLEQDLNEALI